MQTQQHPSTGDRLGRDDNEVHAAIRFAVLAAVAGRGISDRGRAVGQHL